MSEPKLDGWNYRLMRHRAKHPLHERNPEAIPEYQEWLEVHEVYYDAEGKPTTWTKEGEIYVGETREDARWTLENMLKALDRPILEYEEKSV